MQVELKDEQILPERECITPVASLNWKLNGRKVLKVVNPNVRKCAEFRIPACNLVDEWSAIDETPAVSDQAGCTFRVPICHVMLIPA
jgi:hypothetical protein